ncbi:MAG: ATP-binding cassette domain-containing protein [Acidimicrobiia bacterium]
MTTLAIEADHVGRSFKVRRSDPVVALGDVSLEVSRGELFGLLGPNGAGKTTLIKILVTLLLPSSGSARVAGFDVATQAREVRWRIAMVSGGEETGFGMLTLTEQLWMFAQLHGIRTREARRRIAELLEVVGLGDVASRKVSDLSTGMRQRLNLARGLLTEPEVLFLDEPTVGLDVEAARDLRVYIRRWMAERGAGGPGSSPPPRTILLTTHYLAEAEELCDRVAIIDRGTILACDTPARLRRGAGGSTRHQVQVDPLPAPGWEAAVADLRRVAIEGPEELAVDLGPGGDLGVLVAALSAAGSRVRGIARVEPTLEDVFVEIVGGSADSVAHPIPGAVPSSEDIR